MSIEMQHVVQGFAPNIKRFISGDITSHFHKFGIPDNGIPAPVADESMKSAVWFGDNPTKKGEVPVMAAVLDHRESLNYQSKCWYVGAGNIALLELV